MNVRITLVALVLGVAAVLSSAGSASAFFGHRGGCGCDSCDNGCGHRCCLFNLFHKHNDCCCEATCGCEASCGCAEEASCGCAAEASCAAEPSCGCPAEPSCGCSSGRKFKLFGRFRKHGGCGCESSCGAPAECGCGAPAEPSCEAPAASAPAEGEAAPPAPEASTRHWWAPTHA